LLLLVFAALMQLQAQQARLRQQELPRPQVRASPQALQWQSSLMLLLGLLLAESLL
jgi:hypothetical protein